jgi:16S rRNA (guanine527-N7)-methyltransferase
MRNTRRDESWDLLRRRLDSIGETLSHEAHETLRAYEALLIEANARYSLVSPADVSRIVSRHFVDSVEFLRWIPPSGVSVLDIGSGGGLPGLVIQALRRDISVSLLERRHRKRVFLRLAVRRLGLDATRVAAEPADLGAVGLFERVTVRGVGPLAEIAAAAAPFLAERALLLAAKGSRGTEEARVATAALSRLGLSWIEHRIVPLTTRSGERIGSTTLVFRNDGAGCST